MNTLDILYTVDTKGSGTQKSIRFHGDTVLCPSDSKIAVIEKENHIKEIKVKQLTINNSQCIVTWNCYLFLGLGYS
jgi:hypothetical protein